LGKLDVHSQAQAVSVAFRNGLFEPETNGGNHERAPQNGARL
jgi:hypothetical protein